MIRKISLLFVLLGGAQCGFFDLTDVEDPLALLWNHKAPIFDKTQPQCDQASGQGIKTACEHYAQCLFRGGTPGQKCGFMNTCCTYNGYSCSKKTYERVSHFTGSYSNNIAVPCTYQINLLPNVCQVRLDFENFNFEPAQWDLNARTHEYVDDFLSVTPNHYQIPNFGGNNDNQHIYVHVNASLDKTVVLNVHLANRTMSNTLSVSNPTWKIKATQLECPPVSKSFLSHKSKVSTAGNDFDLLAPKGALQYFTENSGTVRSFGQPLNMQAGVTDDLYSYPNNLFYAIAFRRNPHICKVSFTSTYMKIPSSSGSGTIVPPGEPAVSSCIDYLFFPELTIDGTDSDNSKYCGTDLQRLVSGPPGPLYIYFKSDASYSSDQNVDNVNLGFKMDYSLTAC